MWQQLGWMPQSFRQLLRHELTLLPSGTLNQLVGPLERRAGIAQPVDKAHKLGQRLCEMGSMDDLYVALVSE